ncbi:MAG: GNAT family N-acetyltransferase [Lachnospiraceae bacterium]|nr:GNAT family N-acetyltransferase [Lachnospiraceae bacterium]MBP5746041.1 GNAT family N-acetyltransferase [Lachnospiraceae bacterium]
MRLRAFNMDKDLEDMKNWITDERSHALWCANIIRYPLDRDHLAEGLKEAEKRFGDRPFVAVDEEDKAEGFFSYSYNNETKEAMLKFVVVDPKVRGKGVAQNMLKLAAQYAFNETGADALQLNVFPENTRAKKCYEKAGFKERNITYNAFRFKDESWGRCNMIMYR